MYTIELIQAISDWQRGGSMKQKTRRGNKLKEIARDLSIDVRSTNALCYRQIALDKKSVWMIGTDYHISETTSAWTEDIDISKKFKGGVPPDGYQGVIFKINPPTESVVINLNKLFKDAEFIEFVDKNKNKIQDYSKGMGLYKGSQKEVVITIDKLTLNSIECWGGYSSPENKLASKFFGRQPTNEELIDFRRLMVEAGHKCGPYWLSTPEAIERINKKLIENGRILQKRRIG